MPTRRLLLASVLCTLAACGAPGVSHATTAITPSPARTLAAYRSEAELVQALTRWRSEAEKLQGERRRQSAAGVTALQAAPASPAPAAESAAKSADASGRADSITNVQTAGVDEGGIVKRAGDHLVILRRGRLFTVRVGADALQPAAVDARRLRAGRRPAWRVVRRAADLGLDGRRDRLQLRARRHRDRAVRPRPRRLAGLPRHIPPAQLRLLLVAQLREPAGRQQARVLHADAPAPVRASGRGT